MSSLLPQLLTSAKLHLPFCFTDSGSKNRHKQHASQSNNANQRQLAPQWCTRAEKAPLRKSTAIISFLPILPLGTLHEMNTEALISGPSSKDATTGHLSVFPIGPHPSSDHTACQNLWQRADQGCSCLPSRIEKCTRTAMRAGEPLISPRQQLTPEICCIPQGRTRDYHHVLSAPILPAKSQM